MADGLELFSLPDWFFPAGLSERSTFSVGSCTVLKHQPPPCVESRSHTAFISLLPTRNFVLFPSVCFRPGVILCGWLGLKHQLTNFCLFTALGLFSELLLHKLTTTKKKKKVKFGEQNRKRDSSNQLCGYIVVYLFTYILERLASDRHWNGSLSVAIGPLMDAMTWD